MGEVEAGCEVTAAGLAADLRFLGGPSVEPSIAFGKLVELARRSRGETVEALAKRAGLDLGEVLAVEMGEGVPSARGVFQLAQAFRFNAGILMELAGLAEATNPVLRDAALRFAASSEPTAKLSPEEKEAFETFVKVVAEKSGGR
jgi:transcriptional regulator with XRE-family HTH domain